MTLLRLYSRAEWEALPCDPWERCPTCGGGGSLFAHRPFQTTATGCPDCKGHGSARALAFDVLWKVGRGDRNPASAHRWRCEDCGHPMSEGTWEGLPKGDEDEMIGYVLARWSESEWGDQTEAWIADQYPGVVHYSPCDEGCRHGGPVRKLNAYGRGGGATYDALPPGNREGFEASWRQVDARRLSWDHDLRPGQLAVLCLRCLAAR